MSAERGSGLFALQRAFDPLQRATMHGCSLVNDPLPLLREAGFAGVESQHFTLGQSLEQAAAGAAADARGWRPGAGPPPAHFLLSPHLAGVAVKA